MELLSASPVRGEIIGGDTVFLVLKRGASAPTASELTVSWAGGAVPIAKHEFSPDGSAKLHVVVPQGNTLPAVTPCSDDSATAGLTCVQVTITDITDGTTQQFTYAYLPADQPLITHLSPQTLKTTGEEPLQINVDKFDSTRGFNVSLCGTNYHYPGTINLLWQKGSAAISFEVLNAKCAVLGRSTVEVQSAVQTVSAFVEYVAPDIVAMPPRGLLDGGTRVQLLVWGLPAIGTTSVAFGANNVPAESIVRNATTGIATVAVTAPRHTKMETITCVVQHSGGSTPFVLQTFSFTVVKPPYIKKVSPSTGLLAGGEMISIWLRDFPAFKRKQEILIFFGSTRALPTFATHKGTQRA